MILAGGTGSSGESKINAIVKTQIASMHPNSDKMERANIEKLNENMQTVVEKLVDYFFDFNMKIQGHMLRPYYNQASNLAVIPGNTKLMTQELLDRSKFFLLLHLRRIVTTFEGTTQDYLDEVTGYNCYKASGDTHKLGLELQDLISSYYEDDPFSKVQLDQSKTQSLQTLVLDCFSRHARRCNPLSCKGVPASTERSKTVSPTPASLSDPTSLKPQPLSKLTEGLRTIQTLERELESAHLKVKLSQEYMTIQEASNIELRTKLLKDVVQLRDTLFRKNVEHLRDDEIYRVDYFGVNDIGDESIRILLNDKINKVDHAFRTRLKKLQDELQEANQLVKDYDQQLNSNNPAVISSLIKRVHGLLAKDNHMLWKVLQEAIGCDWFERVLLKRDTNHRYHIEYETLDSLIPELNKMVIRRNPGDVSKLGTQMDTVLLGYLIETFHEQKKELVREMNSKLQSRAESLTEGYDELLDEYQSMREGESQKIQTNPLHPSPGGGPVSVSIKISDSRGAGGFPVSKLDTGKSLGLGFSPKSSSNQIAEDKPIFRGEDGSELSVSKLKGRFRMLLNEIHNLKSDKVSLGQNLISLQGQFKILEGLVLELAEAAGVLKEGQSLVNLVGKCKKLDAKVLTKNNFIKILAQGKIDSIARMAVIGTLNNYGGVHKSTNTETTEYDDLAYANNKHGTPEPFKEAITKVMKLRSRPKDNESLKSSGSKLSLSKKFSTVRDGKQKQPDSPKFSLNKKLTLDSLVEEPDLSPILAHSMIKEPSQKQKNPTMSKLEYAHKLNKERGQQANQHSPDNQLRASKPGGIKEITHSMEFGAPSKSHHNYDEKMANVRVRRFESETKPPGPDASMISHTINSKNQGSAFEEYSQTKLKRVEDISDVSDGDSRAQAVIRQRKVSETRTNQKDSGLKVEKKISPLKGADRKSKTMLPKDLLEPTSPTSNQMYFPQRLEKSEMDSIHRLDIFFTGGVQIYGTKKDIIKPQIELFSGASLTEGGVRGKFDSSLATAAIRLPSGHTHLIDEPAGLLEVGFTIRSKKRSLQYVSPVRNSSIIKTRQFEVPEVDSTDSPRLNVQPKEVKLDCLTKRDNSRVKTPSSKMVMKSLISKEDKQNLTGANLIRWQERANSSLVDDSNTSNSKRERETDRSLAPLPEKQRVMMRSKLISTDAIMERNTRDEARKNQIQSRGQEELPAERRPNSASGAQKKFYEDVFQPSGERIRTGKFGQSNSPSRSKSRGLASGNSIKEQQPVVNKVITQSGYLDDSINPWGKSNLTIGVALNNQSGAAQEEIHTDSDLERIKLTMRQQESTIQEDLGNGTRKNLSSPFKRQSKAETRSVSPNGSPKRVDLNQAAHSSPKKSASIPKVLALQSLSQSPENMARKTAGQNSKSTQLKEAGHHRLRQAQEKQEIKFDVLDQQARTKWDDMIYKTTGVLCRLVIIVDDLNGISLVSDPKTNETYLDVSDPMKVFALIQKWRASRTPANIRVSPQTYLTEITEQDITDVACHEYIIPEGTPYDKFVPLDAYPSGELGLKLENLRYLMKKVYEVANKYAEMNLKVKNTGSQFITQATKNSSKKEFVNKTIVGGSSSLSRQNPHQKSSEPSMGMRLLQEQRLAAQYRIFKGAPKTLIQYDPENSRDAEYSINRSSYLGFTRTQISKKTVSLDPVIGGKIHRRDTEVIGAEKSVESQNKTAKTTVDYSLNKLIAQPNTLPSTMKQLFSEHQTRLMQEKYLQRQRLADNILADIKKPDKV